MTDEEALFNMIEMLTVIPEDYAVKELITFWEHAFRKMLDEILILKKRIITIVKEKPITNIVIWTKDEEQVTNGIEKETLEDTKREITIQAEAQIVNEEITKKTVQEDRFNVYENYKENPPLNVYYYEDAVVKRNVNKILSLEEKYHIMLGDNYKHMNRYKTKEEKWKFNPNVFNRQKTYGFETRELFEEYREYQKEKSKTPSTKKVRFCLMDKVTDIRAPPTEGKKKERWKFRKICKYRKKQDALNIFLENQYIRTQKHKQGIIPKWDEIVDIRDELGKAIVAGRPKQEIREIGRYWFKEAKKFIHRRYIWFQKVLFVEWFRTSYDPGDIWNINPDWIHWQFQTSFCTLRLNKGFGDDKKYDIIRDIGKRIVAYQVSIKYILQEQFLHRLKKRGMLSPMEQFVYNNVRSQKDWKLCLHRIERNEEQYWEQDKSIDYDEELEINISKNTRWLKFGINDTAYFLIVIRELEIDVFESRKRKKKKKREKFKIIN
jgi:hypothetical protein